MTLFVDINYNARRRDIKNVQPWSDEGDANSASVASPACGVTVGRNAGKKCHTLVHNMTFSRIM